MELKDRIIQKRVELGIKASHLAELVETTPTTISLLESGKNTNPTAALSIKLAEVFSVSIDWLLTGKEDIIKNETYDKLSDEERRIIRAFADFLVHKQEK